MDRTPTHLVLKSTFHAGIKSFNNLPRSLTILKNQKAKFKVALGQCLDAHFS